MMTKQNGPKKHIIHAMLSGMQAQACYYFGKQDLDAIHNQIRDVGKGQAMSEQQRLEQEKAGQGNQK